MSKKNWVPPNIKLVTETVSESSEIVKYAGLPPMEQELINMVVAILRGENEGSRKAIIKTIEACYEIRNVINAPGEFKKNQQHRIIKFER
ncbi:MAG: hypothetical protein DYG83_09200 [Candidatus Brocadia sp. AMX2]|uniref:Uncharacterized protein n=1 Tax=Candidatus Brocadia sinica JPN1 TaxID=1197129 RepID=A0ABQ0K1E2_9BACT|nr:MULTISPECIES: hypothetical protein [Brocadia]KXK30782.1 MAG: hypothetical protein UZ01_01140 [Candidatus Brocadia sinica]MBC6932542.1 hypothetical protein [Candidatus Brocadia sp.]MBL1168076.1 hypothetical protein [Candidatus Brocadia sp. AMX1]NOG42657.1 hypothetical protein [Planctomycetota bacterium]KAA0243992.1 MAG: hypothetical protein EDM70_08295 [Candidatus Brocadia sp. AMX2]